MYTRFNSFLQFFQTSVALFTLLAVVSFTAYGAFSLNPLSAENFPEVAGASDQFKPFELKTLYNFPGHSFDLDKEDYSRKFSYDITVRKLDEGNTKVQAFELRNPNSFDMKFNINTSLTGRIQEDVDIFLYEGNKEIFLYSSNVSIPDSEIVITAGSTQTYVLSYYSEKNINFPFKLLIELESLDFKE